MEIPGNRFKYNNHPTQSKKCHKIATTLYNETLYLKSTHKTQCKKNKMVQKAKKKKPKKSSL